MAYRMQRVPYRGISAQDRALAFGEQTVTV